MVCQACGHPVETEVRFCTKCGAQVVEEPVASGPPMYAMQPRMVPRVRRNLQTVGILWCVYGAYRVIFGLVGMFFLQTMSMGGFGSGWPMHRGFDSFGPAWMSALLPFVAGITVIAAALAFVVGYGLLTRKPWGRVLGIVVSILALLKFPIGTGLGIYTLWVLAPAQSGLEYEAIADHS